MKYLSLYKTSSEHSADQSRLIPNISLITDEQRLILTNENNNATIFKEVDILESFDDIINRFSTRNFFDGMPGLKIYGDNSDKSKAKNIKLYNNAQQWRKDFILHAGYSDRGQVVFRNVDALLIDNIIMDKYDGNYEYGSYKYTIDIYNNRIILLKDHYYDQYRLEILTISNDGLVTFNLYNIYPSPTETRMPGLYIYRDKSLKNIRLYNSAQDWREDYISYNGLSDTGQPIRMFVDKLYIDGALMDEYNNSYNYHIDIYNDHIILYNNDSEEILTISSDGLVTILDIFNKFPYPKGNFQNMPGLKIYTDNTNQSKANNIEIYNDAKKYLNDLILKFGWSDDTDGVIVTIDALIIDDETIDQYDGNYNYSIDIYNNRIILHAIKGSNVLTIYGDGSVDVYVIPTPTPDSDTTTTTTIMATTTTTTMAPTTTTTTMTPTTTLPIFNKFPTPTDTFMPGIKIYTDDSYQSKSNNIELYNNAQEWRGNYISDNGLIDTGQAIFMNADALIIDEVNIDEYDGKYNYYIGIHGDSIILLKNYDLEILTIFSDGSVQFLFNKFPSNTSTHIPGLKIYTDNTDESKSNNIELYNNAQKWRKNYISYKGLNDTGQGIRMDVDGLIIDGLVEDKYNGVYRYYIDIYNSNITLYEWGDQKILTIYGDGSVEKYITPTPTPNTVPAR